MASNTPKVSDLTDIPGAKAKDLQFPSLAGSPQVEVAERSADQERASAASFDKVFVTLAQQYELDPEGVHERNATQVRQFLLHQGLRTDAKVDFVGTEEPEGEPAGLPARRQSVALRYRIAAEPAATATDPKVVHMQVPDDQTHPLDRPPFAQKAAEPAPKTQTR